VTGAALGLGLGIAKELAARGARVVIADLQEEKSTAAADSLAETGLSVVATQMDISDSDSVDRCFGRLVEAHGRIDVLVNNAGVGQHVAPIVALADQEWQRVINVTLTGTFYCCRAAVPHLKRSKGTIINIASTAGQRGEAFHSHYAATKGATISFTKSLAPELVADGIRVNCVAPGWVATNMSRDALASADAERYLSLIPMGRPGTPDEIAGAIVFLASD
jgi:NAD(P)-dependent dehydrogenase (short-subunit alcohol dehydrogenase family)